MNIRVLEKMENNFYIRKISTDSAALVIEETGFDRHYIKKALAKYNFTLIKVHNLTCPQANIIKQLALSVGADAAVHREVITCKVEFTDILIGTSHSQAKLLAEKLKHQPFKLPKLGELILEQIQMHHPEPIKINNITFNWAKKTYIMGILNITPDSFSDGGKYLSLKEAEQQIIKMINNRVDIIDVGGESTKPFSKEVLPDEQIKRIIPVIKKIREINKDIPISIDTRHSKVAAEAVNSGANIINDVSGFDWDKNMCKVVKDLDIPIIIMHSLSNPETMQLNPEYDDNIVNSVYKSLCDKVQKAVKYGIKRENIIIDPGIGFGKTLEHNIELIKRIEEFKSLNLPILVGVSRKSIISNIINVPPEERDDATLALNSYLASNGANIIRVHDIEKHCKSFKVLDRIIK